jgi:SAM-dependent methyltransferase
MSNTYSHYADICTKFYELTTPPEAVAQFVFEKCHAEPGQHALFVGGMFGVAAALVNQGLQLTIVDYTDEMVELGRRRVPSATVLKSDIRELPFKGEFDLVLVVGRVLTHMTTDSDLDRALHSCRGALRGGGTLFADNYEDTKIQKTNYFNGRIEGRDSSSQILRVSTTTQISGQPLVVRWDAEYSGEFDGAPFHFRDSIDHRAFSRQEFADCLRSAGFTAITQGDNFDETSFYSVAKRFV